MPEILPDRVGSLALDSQQLQAMTGMLDEFQIANKKLTNNYNSFAK